MWHNPSQFLCLFSNPGHFSVWQALAARGSSWCNSPSFSAYLNISYSKLCLQHHVPSKTPLLNGSCHQGCSFGSCHGLSPVLLSRHVTGATWSSISPPGHQRCFWLGLWQVHFPFRSSDLLPSWSAKPLRFPWCPCTVWCICRNE